MNEIEIKTLIDPLAADAEYIREVAETKRALELWTMDAAFKKFFEENPAAALAENNLHVDAQAVKILVDAAEAQKYSDTPEKLPREVLRYRAFIREKELGRDVITSELCVPTDENFKAWRRRQLNRCWVELGQHNKKIIHAPLTFELDLGCSVGCPFCGIAAPKLQKICRYDAETQILWRGILNFVREKIGTAAGAGTCYYATEPLDNPDYEKFSDDFFEVFGIVPQITTAAAMRNPARIKNFLETSLKKYRRIHRFSILKLETLKKVMEYFTPEELLCVELLPQFPEAPANRYVSAGRAREINPDDDGDTIACISGFVVNMAEKSMRLITPCSASAKYPTGEQIIAREKFTDLDDFKKVFSGMIQRCMQKDFPKTQPLYLRGGISFEEVDGGIEFFVPGKLRLKFHGKDDLKPEIYHEVLRKLSAGGKSAREIAGELLDEKDISPAYVFFILRKFELAGLFFEPYEVA